MNINPNIHLSPNGGMCYRMCVEKNTIEYAMTNKLFTDK